MALVVVHDVAEQRNRLDVAAIPAHVAAGRAGVGLDLVALGNRWRRDFKGIAEKGRLDALRIGVIALCFGAARDVQVDAEIAIAVFLHQRVTQVAPLLLAPVELDFDRRQAMLHAIDVRAEADHPATVGGNDFINAVAEQESTIHR